MWNFQVEYAERLEDLLVELTTLCENGNGSLKIVFAVPPRNRQ